MPKKTDQQKATDKVKRLEARQARRNPKTTKPQFQSRGTFGIDQGINWADPTDAYANSFDNYIHFASTISAKNIRFKAMLTQFEDQFSSEWNSEQVYGRNDPIQTFRNTTRTISIGWDAPAASFAEAATNMLNAAELTRMLYPSYQQRRNSEDNKSLGSVSTINKSPMIKVKLRNLIQGYNGAELLVTLDGITFSPDLEAGWFDKNEDLEALFSGQNEKQLVPKLLKFSCTMTVLHQTTIGHNGANRWPSSLSEFPNLPPYTTKSGIISAGAEADRLRQGAGFDEEEAAAFHAALEASEFAAAGDAAQRSDRQKTRDSRKSDRQERRAKNLEANIKEAEDAAAQSWYILGGEPK